MTKRDRSSSERTKFVHEREREEREDVTMRMQVCKYKKYIHHCGGEHREMDGGPFNLVQCCFLVKSR